jgi:hypothetical protein
VVVPLVLPESSPVMNSGVIVIRRDREEDDGREPTVSASDLKRGREGHLAFGPARQAIGPAQFV